MQIWYKYIRVVQNAQKYCEKSVKKNRFKQIDKKL